LVFVFLAPRHNWLLGWIDDVRWVHDLIARVDCFEAGGLWALGLVFDKNSFGLLRNRFWLLLNFLDVFLFLLLFDVCLFDLLFSILFVGWLSLIGLYFHFNKVGRFGWDFINLASGCF
jgi:hypothetical protein